MDIEHIHNGIHFLWNETKDQKNQTKHGVSFKQAASAFFDPFLKVIDASQNNETRDALIGIDENWNMLFVVHIQIEEDYIRIISARKVTKIERQYYED